MERRKTRRIYEPFTATVGGVDDSGTPFDFQTVLDNISSGGLYLYFPLRCSPMSRQNFGQFKVVSAACFIPCR